MYICNILYMSTCHITEATDNLMANGKIRDLVYYPKVEDGMQYGYFIYTEDFMGNDVPEDLVRCVEFARNNGCSWINMDCDGDEVDGLPVYEL